MWATENAGRKPRLAAAAGLALMVLAEVGPSAAAADLVPIPALGLRVARGFRVTLWADAGLANDIRALALDARGDVLVTGPGYLRTLLDVNRDGLADTVREFAPMGGGSGLCCDGADVYCVGDGALLRYSDRDGDGVADGQPQRLLTVETSEHGAHGLRRGPDGWLYLITGNQSGLTGEQVGSDSSPIRRSEGGVLLRIARDGVPVEVIAHGFFNPYGFDFNWLGDMFAADGGVDEDLFLPWHLPGRVYHVLQGGHHGCRSDNRQHAQARPDYYEDTADILAATGNGLPKGVVCYRHQQFPLAFRNGLFSVDWAQGRVHFTGLPPEGSSYAGAPEPFLEAMGASGFTPTDLAVAPDGALLVATGGRQTRGAIYRIDHPVPGLPFAPFTSLLTTVALEVERLLNAPQPLDAWSRAVWVPQAQRLGPEPFAQAMMDGRLGPSARVRAVEVLTELFGGLAPAVAAAGAQANTPFVRARVAWSLGRTPADNYVPLLVALARDPAPHVRVSALDAIAAHAPDVDLQAQQTALAANLTHPDRRVRQSAVRLASILPDPAWRALWVQRANADAQSRLSMAFALLNRSPSAGVNVSAAEAALSSLALSRVPEQRLQALRVLILALGDFRWRDPTFAVYATCEVAASLAGQDGLAAKVRAAVGALVPSGDPLVDLEATRLLAMLEDDAAATPAKVLGLVTEQTAPETDFHYLVVLSKLKGPRGDKLAERTAHVLLSLDRKLQGRELRGPQNWTTRLAEVVPGLQERDPRLADAILKHPGFPSPAHVVMVGLLGPERYLAAARRFLEAVRRNPDFVWSGHLLDLLASVPGEDLRPLFRQQWANATLRDELLLKLASIPEVADRDKYLAGLGSEQLEVVRASMSALMKLPRGEASRVLVPALRLLRRMLGLPREQIVRAQVLALLSVETGQKFQVREQDTSPEALAAAYQPVFDWCTTKYSGISRQIEIDNLEDPGVWTLRLKAAVWSRGDPMRGQGVFDNLGCRDCHGGAGTLGPSLGGVAGQVSPVELFSSVVFPSRHVQPQYRPTILRSRDGLTFSGLPVYQSHDWVILQTGALTTVRLREADIVSRQPSPQSFMPARLLNGLKAQEMADLYQYLRTLPPAAR